MVEGKGVTYLIHYKHPSNEVENQTYVIYPNCLKNTSQNLILFRKSKHLHLNFWEMIKSRILVNQRIRGPMISKV